MGCGAVENTESPLSVSCDRRRGGPGVYCCTLVPFQIFFPFLVVVDSMIRGVRASARGIGLIGPLTC